jgi:hypothetical protein
MHILNNMYLALYTIVCLTPSFKVQRVRIEVQTYVEFENDKMWNLYTYYP